MRAKKAAKVHKSPVRSKRNEKNEASLDNLPEFDTYCQYISETKLSASEQDAKKKNKEKFLDYIRSNASKRERRKTLEKKLNAELDNKENNGANALVAEQEQKPRKPSVPRLSYMARTGKRTKSEMAKLEATISQKDEGCKPPQPKNYTDYISKKADKPKPSTQPEPVVTRLDRNNQNIEIKSEEQIDEENCDNVAAKVMSVRSRIEDIVQKAASLVIAEKKPPRLETYSWLPGVSEEKSEITDRSNAYDSRSRRLQELEERIRCLSPCSSLMGTVTGNGRDESSCIGIELQSDSNSQISEVTFHQQNQFGPKRTQDKDINIKNREKPKQHILDHIEEHSSSNDTSTEIFPRAHIQPTQLHSNQPSLYNNDTAFSWSVSLTNESESTMNKRASGGGSESNHVFSNSEKCSQQSCTLNHEEISLDVDQHRPSPCVQPFARPMPVTWEEAPVPRGYEVQSKSDSRVVDDILSLL
eukprot:scaffold62042_cov73-Cyclotella_meneghiniana.AAC.7